MNDLEKAQYLDRCHEYHPPGGTQPARYKALRSDGRGLAKLILDNCPESRERSLALTKLEESIMWANAAIARNEVPVPAGDTE